MPGFYKKAAIIFLALVSVNILSALFCISGYYTDASLLPADDPWKYKSRVDVSSGRGSSITFNEIKENLDFNYILSEDVKYPYARLVFNFENPDKKEHYVDFSSFRELSFDVRCSHNNVMAFSLWTFDPKVTVPNNASSFRISSYWFECSEEWKPIRFRLEQLEVPFWWLGQHGFERHERAYDLSKVAAFTFDSSRRGVLGSQINVRISELGLHGVNQWYLWVFGLSFITLWVPFAVWFFKVYSRSLILHTRTQVLEGPIADALKADSNTLDRGDKDLVVQYLAKEYSNPDLSMELLASDLALTRKEVSEILSEGLGYNFRVYLNKIRLTEAARLLCEMPDLSVNEIALSVGYKSVAHFYKIFKDEFSCSPKKYRESRIVESRDQ